MILVVENDKNIRMAIVELLSSNGYKTITAKNGNEAISIIDDMLPKLVISDTLMPKVNGYQVLEHLRNLRLPIHIPFIFLSSKIDSSEIREGMTTGADDYLTKPFRAKELLASVKTQLKKYDELERRVSNLYLNISKFITTEFQSPLNNLIANATALSIDHEKIEKLAIHEALDNIKESSQKLYFVMDKFANYFKIQNRLALPNKFDPFLIQSYSQTDLIKKIFFGKLENSNVQHDLKFNLTDSRITIPENDFKIIFEVVAQYIIDYTEAESAIEVNSSTKKNDYLIEIVFKEKTNNKRVIEKNKFQPSLNKLDHKSGINIVLSSIKKMMSLYNSKIITEKRNEERLAILIEIPIAN